MPSWKEEGRMKNWRNQESLRNQGARRGPDASVRGACHPEFTAEIQRRGALTADFVGKDKNDNRVRI